MNSILDWLLTPLLDALPILQPYAWIIQGLVILVITGTVSVLVNRILNLTLERLRARSPGWDEVALAAVRKPIRFFIWVVGLTFSLEIAALALDNIDLTLAQEFRSLAFILLISWSLIRLISRIEVKLVQNTTNQKGIDRTTADAIAKLLRLVVIVFSALMLLQNLGVSISGILAFGGVGGLAVGFAAKDLLANFFGGLMIYMDRPFNVGDWVRSPDKEIEGTVESIGWRLTRIRTFDKRPLYVPNSTFASIAVENPSRMTNRRIFETIGVRYDDVLTVEAVVSDIREMLENHEEIDTDQTLIVNLNRFGPSSLDIMVYTFTKTTQWVPYHQIKQDILMKIINIILARGAEVAYPTSTMHLATIPEIEHGPEIEEGSVTQQAN